jgi:hypothetical protein
MAGGPGRPSPQGAGPSSAPAVPIEYRGRAGVREVLDLPLQGALKPSEINSAFRRRAKTTRPDAGGANEEYHRITEARNALLKLFADDW